MKLTHVNEFIEERNLKRKAEENGKNPALVKSKKRLKRLKKQFSMVMVSPGNNKIIK